jgi:hypothetical protein
MKMSAYLEPSSTVKIRRCMMQTCRAAGATLESSHTLKRARARQSAQRQKYHPSVA